MYWISKFQICSWISWFLDTGNINIQFWTNNRIMRLFWLKLYPENSFLIGNFNLFWGGGWGWVQSMDIQIIIKIRYEDYLEQKIDLEAHKATDTGWRVRSTFTQGCILFHSSWKTSQIFLLFSPHLFPSLFFLFSFCFFIPFSPFSFFFLLFPPVQIENLPK